MIARYVNHKGDAVELDHGGIYLDETYMQDWGLSYSTVNGRSASFKRLRKEIEVGAVVVADSDDDGAALRNRIYEVAIVDVEAGKPGRLYVDEWYMDGYFISSNKSCWWYSNRAANYSFTFLADNPVWTKEHIYSFKPIASGVATGLDYPHGYPHNYGPTTSGSIVLENPSILAAPVKMVVYGPAESPRITIGGNAYSVDTDVPDGGILTIDAPTRTIVKRDRYGAVSNCFQHRAGNQRKGGGSYIFEPVPSGVSEVTWDGSFGFDVTLYEQRDEWRWE